VSNRKTREFPDHRPRNGHGWEVVSEFCGSAAADAYDADYPSALAPRQGTGTRDGVAVSRGVAPDPW